MDLLQEDLTRVVNNWNNHTIRATCNAECPNEKPNILYLPPGENGNVALRGLWFATVNGGFFMILNECFCHSERKNKYRKRNVLI